MKKILAKIRSWFTHRPRPLAPSTVTTTAVRTPEAPVVTTNIPSVFPSIVAAAPSPIVPPVGSVPPMAPSPTVSPAPQPPVVLPAFSDSFSTGKLDDAKWVPSNWNAPGGGRFSPDQLDFSHGCLRITVNQGNELSLGGELRSKQKFGFGTYEWVMRASSTSDTPDGPGKAVSGQISSGFIFQQDSGYTEIDCPEIEGQHPDQISWTSWVDNQTRENTNTSTPNPEASFHSYKMVWTPTEIDFYVDGIFVCRNSVHVPQNPAYIMINHWGTNSVGWGGLATPGVSRYMFVRSVSYTPLS